MKPRFFIGFSAASASLALAACSTPPKPALVVDRDGITPCSGISMLPAFPEHCGIRVVPVPFDQLAPGKPVVWFNVWVGHAINHVIVRRAPFGNGWVTRGINNNWDDIGLVTPKNYYGVSELAQR